MTNLYCEHCNYRFPLKAGKGIPKKCPYCDAKDTIKVVKTAQDWLDDISSVEEM